jgi:festuclavine dehydrogenase
MSDNFTEMESRLNPKESTKIYSASGDGKIPFIACDDIAAVAFRALTDEKPHNTDHMILGPELMTYQDVS